MDENQNEIDQTEVVLTKAKLLQGIEDVEEVQTSMGIFKVRPMTEGEKARAEGIVFKGLKASGGISNMENLKIEGDAGQIFDNQSEYDFFITMCGLNLKGSKPAEKYSIQDIKNINFKPTVLKTLVARIQAISGLESLEEKVTEFFRDPPGNGTDKNDSSQGDGTSEAK